jgi:hypothetical protein
VSPDSLDAASGRLGPGFDGMNFSLRALWAALSDVNFTGNTHFDLSGGVHRRTA